MASFPRQGLGLVVRFDPLAQLHDLLQSTNVGEGGVMVDEAAPGRKS